MYIRDRILYEIFRQTVGMQDRKWIAVVEEPYYYDYNLSYGETFEYWVVAHVTYPVVVDYAADVRSLPTNSATATMVDQGEVDKYLGIQDYWSYLTADMGNGTGYINTASGNPVSYTHLDVYMRQVYGACGKYFSVAILHPNHQFS